MGVTRRGSRQSGKLEEVGLELFPKRFNRGTVSYMKGERVPKDWGIVTEGIREVFD